MSDHGNIRCSEAEDRCQVLQTLWLSKHLINIKEMKIADTYIYIYIATVWLLHQAVSSTPRDYVEKESFE